MATLLPKVWYRADQGLYTDSAKTTKATATGDAVYVLADLSRNGNDATQATSGLRPTLQRDAFNGRPAVRSDGTKWMSCSYTGPIAMVIALGKNTHGPNINAAFAGAASPDGIGSWYLNVGSQNSGSATIWPTAAATYDWLAATGNTTELVNVVHSLAMRVNGTSLELWRNGILRASDQRTGLPFRTGAIRIFADDVNGSASDILQGDIHELRIYDQMPTADQMREIQLELAQWAGGALTANYVIPSWGVTGPNDTVLAPVESADGINWESAGYAAYNAPTGIARDGDIYQHPISRLWYCVHGVSNANQKSTVAQIAVSVDGRFWEPHAAIDFSAVTGNGSGARVWAPKFITDASGNLYVTAATGSAGDSVSMQPAICRCNGPSLLSWGAASLITGAGIPANTIDFCAIQLTPTTYAAVLKNETSKDFIFLTSTSLVSGWTAVATIANGIEGGSLVTMSERMLRVYYDRYSTSSGMAYRESADSGATWSAEQSLNMPFTMRHGAIRRNGLASPLLQDAAKPKVDSLYQRVDAAISSRSTFAAGGNVNRPCGGARALLPTSPPTALATSSSSHP